MQLTVDSGQLPMGWEIKKLSEVCQIEKSQGIYTHLPYIGMENIESNTARFIGSTKPQSVKSSTFKFSPNHVLYGRLRPYLNKVLAPHFIGHCSTEIFPIKPSECLNKNFLLYWLLMDSTVKRINATCTGARMPRANMNDVFEFDFPLPPLSEQKRIVAILDEAFEGIDRAIANTEKNLANSRELFESYLNAIFTQKGDRWEEKTLNQVSIQFGRGKSRHRPRNDKKLYGGEYPFIQTGDIRNSNHIVTSYSQTYNEVGLAQSKLWPKGTVCITIAANIAETGVLAFEACIPDSVIGLVVDQNKANNMFVEYMLQAFKIVLKAKGKGSAQDNINMGTFEAQTFPFPSIDEQERIVSKLDFLSTETQRLETIYRQKIAALKELKQSILQKAFTGELTVRLSSPTTADTAKTAEEEIAA
jgi:type I restriction enzyme, S subunit